MFYYIDCKILYLAFKKIYYEYIRILYYIICFCLICSCAQYVNYGILCVLLSFYASH